MCDRGSSSFYRLKEESHKIHPNITIEYSSEKIKKMLEKFVFQIVTSALSALPGCFIKCMCNVLSMNSMGYFMGRCDCEYLNELWTFREESRL